MLTARSCRGSRAPAGRGFTNAIDGDPARSDGQEDRTMFALPPAIVRQILQSRPAAMRLLNEMVEFYGQRLIIREQSHGLPFSSCDLVKSLRPQPVFHEAQ